MRKTIQIYLFSLLISIGVLAQAPTKAWDKTFGGTLYEQLLSMQETSDNGFVFGGTSISGISGNKTSANKGGPDYYVVKTDANGNMVWDKNYGTSGLDYMGVVLQTSDGGYLVGGSSSSGINQDKTEISRGSFDFWIVKTDANGIIEWDKTYGGDAADQIYDMKATNDGGYIIGGTSSSNISSEKSQSNRGSDDYWAVKIDSIGTLEWDVTYGGSGNDRLEAIVIASDGGYLLGGTSSSGANFDKTDPNCGGSNNMWVVKISSNGTKEWDKTIGATGATYLYDAITTNEGGFLLGGQVQSNASCDKCETSRGASDYWIYKMTLDGTKEWDRRFGSNDLDIFYALQQTTDGGYLLSGGSEAELASGDKTEDAKFQARTNPTEGENFWVVKTDSRGNLQWDKTVGSYNGDTLFVLNLYREEAYGKAYQTADGGYIVGGSSSGPIGADKTEGNIGDWDLWIIKLNNNETIPPYKHKDTINYSICQLGDSVQLNVGALDGLNYAWTPALEVSDASAKEPFAKPLSFPRIFRLVKEQFSCGVMDTFYFRITLDTITSNATVSFTDTTICAGINTGLMASGGTAYIWSPSTSLSNPNIANPIANPTTDITYKVIVSNGTCSFDSAFINFTTIASPSLSVSDDTIACDGDSSFIFNASTDGSEINWYYQGSASLLDTGSNFSVSLLINTNIVAEAVSGSCFTYDTIMVSFVNCDTTITTPPDSVYPPGEIFVANAFSPNNDGENDFLKMNVYSLIDLDYFKIYNRWGILVFETSDVNMAWDGNNNGKEQNPGAYVYVIGYSTNDEALIKRGNITLIR